MGEPRDVFIYDPEVPVYGPGGPGALSGPWDQAALGTGQQPPDLYLGCVGGAAAYFWSSRSRDPLQHLCGLRRPGCQAGASDSGWPSRVYLYRDCALDLLVPRIVLCQGTCALLALSARADLLRFFLKENRFAWRLPAVHFLYMIGTRRRRMLSPAWLIRGTGLAPLTRFFMNRALLLVFDFR